MQKIMLISVGRLKDSFFKAAEAEYAKRIGGFCTYQSVEIPAGTLPERPAAAQIEAVLESEGAAILAKLPKNAFCVALCVEGKPQTSEQLAQLIADNANLGSGCMAFVIGSSYGLSPVVKTACAVRLSMSAMTFPHRLARIMLLEQIYRGFKINSGSTYHK